MCGDAGTPFLAFFEALCLETHALVSLLMGSPKLQHKSELKKTVMIATLKISINGLYSSNP